ncbi:hypothetical protein, partial [Aeromonas salmonicida]|uniref:hypothetical protein n=1 Tax=Aeromonas salmonicida TaxID=645 RepID=UPI003D3240DA
GLTGREVFICGPHGFMADAAARLCALGVAADRIKQESFGGGADFGDAFGDIFGDIFGGRNGGGRRGPARGSD